MEFESPFPTSSAVCEIQTTNVGNDVFQLGSDGSSATSWVGAVGQLAWLITKRSEVRVLHPQQNENTAARNYRLL